MFELDWDETKRRRTLRERGLDFLSVSRLDWDRSLTAQDRRRNYGEIRHVTIGPIDGRLHVLAWCWRADRMRIISLRKANERERERYEQTLQDR